MRSSKDQLPTKGNHEKLELSIDWQKPRMRLWSKNISLVVTLTFLFPYLTWAFTPATFPQPVHEILFNRQRVQIPHSLGTVVEAHPGGGQLVVYVQDLHCNYEVQNNISRLIDTLADKHGLNLVTVEGMDRPVDVSRLSTIPPSTRYRSPMGCGERTPGMPMLARITSAKDPRSMTTRSPVARSAATARYRRGSESKSIGEGIDIVARSR